MSKINASIMYVGDVDSGRQLLKAAKTRGWHVYLPGETMEALSVHIFYYPDLVVLDRSSYPIMAAEVAHHLRSLNDETPMLEIAGVDLPVLLAKIEATLEDFTTTTHHR
ncbi:MAG TPA: hypothetical protein VHL11_10040 [Phototrophicaceae bacterium]|jgi:hypothetical protein|nr:hypothetical protein [Phototrophicaceae bacterium]